MHNGAARCGSWLPFGCCVHWHLLVNKIWNESSEHTNREYGLFLLSNKRKEEKKCLKANGIDGKIDIFTFLYKKEKKTSSKVRKSGGSTETSIRTDTKFKWTMACGEACSTIAYCHFDIESKEKSTRENFDHIRKEHTHTAQHCTL